MFPHLKNLFIYICAYTLALKSCYVFAASETFQVRMNLLPGMKITQNGAFAFSVNNGSSGNIKLRSENLVSLTSPFEDSYSIAIERLNISSETGIIEITNWNYTEDKNNTDTFDTSYRKSSISLGATARFVGKEKTGKYAGTTTFTIIYN